LPHGEAEHGGNLATGPVGGSSLSTATPLPVAVGFEIADGVIVGSRPVRAAGEGGPEAVRSVVTEFAAALE
jgi:tryptophan synthase alpha subunit